MTGPGVTVTTAADGGPAVTADSFGREISARGISYEGADTLSRELASWNPVLASPGVDIEGWEELTARTRDLYRNDGHMSGAVRIFKDNLVGGNFRLTAKPDWRALGQSAEWAQEWGNNVEARFHTWAYDPDCWIDASRQLTLAGIVNQGIHSYMTAGDVLAVAEWLDDRDPIHPFTAIKTLDPDRLCNPNDGMDTETVRRGIRYSRRGEPLAYAIRSAHRFETFISMDRYTWKWVSRETAWGRRKVMHIFDQDRPDQPRGVSRFASVLRKSKMFDKFDRATLEAAILQAIYAAVIESEFDGNAIAAALGGGDFDDTSLGQYLAALGKFHKGANVTFNGVKVPHLFPNERFNLTKPEHPMASVEAFTRNCLRHFAAGLGLSYEQLARDYSQTNYSGARAGWLETWKHFHAVRQQVPAAEASLIYALWLEEEMDRGDVERPRGAPVFWAAKSAWCGCQWLGPGEGNIDPLKEETAAAMRLEGSRMTLQEYFAAKGKDWRAEVDQMALERKVLAEAGLTGGGAMTTNVRVEAEP